MKWLPIAIVLVSQAPALYGNEEVARWTFNELHQGEVVRDEAGKAHARLMGRVDGAMFQPGLEGQALLLEAGSRHLDVAAEVAPSLVEDFTIRAVILPYQVHSFRTIFWKGDRTKSPEAINYLLGLRDGKVEFKYKDREGAWTIFSVQQKIEANEWLDIYLYHNGDSAEIWLNGEKRPVLRSRTESTDFRLVENGAMAQMGVSENSTHGQDFWFYGLLDELAIYRGRLPIDAQGAVATFQEQLMDYEDRKSAYQEAQKERDHQRSKEVEERYQTFYDKLADGKSMVVRVAPATIRLENREDLVPILENTSDSIRVSAAGGEAEGVQLLVATGGASGAEGVKVELSPLVHESGAKLPSEAMRWGWIRSIVTERPGIPVDYVGAIPDIIVEGGGSFRVEKRSFEPVLLRYAIPEGATPGVYRGIVRVVSSNEEVQVPVEVNVYGFTLPKRGTLKVAFSFFEQYYRQWYGKEALSPEEKMRIYQFLLSYRIPPSNIYTKDAVYPDLESLEKIKDQTNFLTVAGWGEQAVTQGEIEKRVANYRSTLEQVDALGLKDYAYFYGVDEIAGHLEKGLPGAKQAHTALSENFPTLGMMQTSFPLPEIRDLYNVWVPLVDFFGMPERLGQIEQMREQGNKIWWYVADTPLHPYPNFFLDYPVYDSRVFGVLSWAYKVEGILYWSINREWLTNIDERETWPDAKWRPYIYHISQGTRKQRNGMGNLIYPGPNGTIYPSLRLENFRDGLEDYEYIALLSRLVNQAKDHGKVDAQLVQQALKLLNVPQDVAKAVNDYNSDPKPLARYREEVAGMIETLQEKLK